MSKLGNSEKIPLSRNFFLQMFSPLLLSRRRLSTMSGDNPGFVYAYGWNRFQMGIIGVWPEKHHNFIMKNRSLYFGLHVTLLIWIPMTASLYFLRDNLDDLVDCLVINVPIFMAIYKLVLFRVRREAIQNFIDAMADDWAVERTDEVEKAMLKTVKYARFISTVSVSLAGAMFITFTSTKAYAAPFERAMITNETRLAMGFLYHAYFPYDTKETRPYLMTWAGQFIGTVFTLVGYSGPDSFVAMMILHLCGQLAAIRIALTNIVDDECLAKPELYWKRLSAIIERHEDLNRHGESLEAAFNQLLLVQMVLCTLTFCFQGFVTISTLIDGSEDGENTPILETIFVIIHGFYLILHLFVYCWTGDLLMVESTALTYAPYESEWFRLEPAQARALMMITHRSRTPLQITAGKFIGFSLELFTSIMKTSMGYLSVLLAVKDEE